MLEENVMPQGDKRKYSDKQVREADHIAEGYRKRGKSEGWSKKVAWATVNKVRQVSLRQAPNMSRAGQCAP